jgi:hypothetical protein
MLSLLIPACIGFLIGGLTGAVWAVLLVWGLMVMFGALLAVCE